MYKPRVFLWLAMAIAIAAVLPSPAWADGKFFPVAAYKVQPRIPSQRAMIVFREGQETLIVESSLDGQGQEFGWIVPVPSRPTTVEEASPGFIKTLSMAIQPEITHQVRDLELWAWIAVVVVIAISFKMILRPSGLASVILLVVLMILLVGLFMPTLGAGRGGSGAVSIRGVQVIDSQQVGGFEVSTLVADTSDALDQWLGVNGFARLSEQDKPIVRDYIAESWCFVAARLRRDGNGLSRPHPLAIGFPTGQPVYPMRLTATVGSDVYVEIFAIADQCLDCTGLSVEVADRYTLRAGVWKRPGTTDLVAGFVGAHHDQKIGHPDAGQYLWDGCWITKLTGILRSDQMLRDLQLRPAGRQGSYRRHYYSFLGAGQTTLVIALIYLTVMVVVLTLWLSIRMKDRVSRRHYVSMVLLPSLLVSVGVGSIQYWALPKVEVQTSSPFRYPIWLRELEVRSAMEWTGLDGLPMPQIEQAVQHRLQSQAVKNPFTNDPIQNEASPGNYTLLEDNRGPVLRVYSQEGFPADLPLRRQ